MIPLLLSLLKKLVRAIKRNRILISILVFIVVTLINGALFYYAEAIIGGNHKLTFFDCIYWAIVTATTVGYGDIVPRTFWGHVITIETILVGIATFTVMVSLIAESFISRALRGMLGLGKVKKTDVLVIGCGEICREAIEELRINRPDFKICWLVERRPKNPPEDIEYVVGDPTEPATLERAGARSAKYVLVCLSDDSKIIHTVLSIRKINRKARIAAIAWSKRAQELLKEAGVAIVVPLRIIGRMLASAAFEPIVPIFLEQATTMRGVADLIEVDIDEKLSGKPLRELLRRLELESGKRYVPLMICHKDGKSILAPSWETIVTEGDRVLLLKINVESPEDLAKCLVSEQQSSSS